MNTHRLPVLLTALAALCVASPRLLAQGALVPAGPPGPTFKTLAQVEPRTPLVAGSPGVAIAADGGITISASGSYYLTQNLRIQTGGVGHGIIIATSGVSLDLNGFSISLAGSNAGAAIYIFNSTATQKQITIRNGHISGTHTITELPASINDGEGFAYGVHCPASAINHVVIEDLTIAGVTQDGISLPPSGYTNSNRVSRCTVTDCGENGIKSSVVENSTVSRARATGISAQHVRDSYAYAGRTGILASTADKSEGRAWLTGFSGTPSYGMNITIRATDCVGWNIGFGAGLGAGHAINCRGESAVNPSNPTNGNGYGISGTVVHASIARSAGIALFAHIAVGCYAQGEPAVITHRYNMPSTP